MWPNPTLVRRVMTVVLSTIVLFTSCLFIILWIDPTNASERMDLLRTFAQLLGGIAFVVGLYFTAKSLRNSQENIRISQDAHDLAIESLLEQRKSQFTDRFYKAIEQLGSAEEDVRVGALYSLRMIAHDSEGLHQQCIDMVTYFIRRRAEQGLGSKLPLLGDVQVALGVLGHWYPNNKSRSMNGSNLSHLNLAGYSFCQGFYQHVDFSASDLTRADFTQSDLTGADFTSSICSRAVFTFAELGHTTFHGAKLDLAIFMNETLLTNAKIGSLGNRGSESDILASNPDIKLEGTKMTFAGPAGIPVAPHLRLATMGDVTRNRMKSTNFSHASTERSWFVASDLSRVNGLSAEQLQRSLWNEVTVLPETSEISKGGINSTLHSEEE